MATPVKEKDWRTLSNRKSLVNKLILKNNDISQEQQVLLLTKLAETGDQYLMLRSAFEMFSIDIMPSNAQLDLVMQDKVPAFWFSRSVARLRTELAYTWINDHFHLYHNFQQCVLAKQVISQDTGFELSQVVKWLQAEIQLLPDFYPAQVEGEHSFKSIDERHKDCDPLNVLIKVLVKPHPISLNLSQQLFAIENEPLKFAGAVGLMFNGKKNSQLYFNEWLNSPDDFKKKLANKVIKELEKEK